MHIVARIDFTWYHSVNNEGLLFLLSDTVKTGFLKKTGFMFSDCGVNKLVKLAAHYVVSFGFILSSRG